MIWWYTVEIFYYLLLYLSFFYNKNFTQEDQMIGFYNKKCYKLHTKTIFESNSIIYGSKTRQLNWVVVLISYQNINHQTPIWNKWYFISKTSSSTIGLTIEKELKSNPVSFDPIDSLWGVGGACGYIWYYLWKLRNMNQIIVYHRSLFMSINYDPILL